MFYGMLVSLHSLLVTVERRAAPAEHVPIHFLPGMLKHLQNTIDYGMSRNNDHLQVQASMRCLLVYLC